MAGDEVFRVVAEWNDGTTSAYVTVPVGENVRGFAFTDPLGTLQQLRWYDTTGAELGVAGP